MGDKKYVQKDQANGKSTDDKVSHSSYQNYDFYLAWERQHNQQFRSDASPGGVSARLVEIGDFTAMADCPECHWGAVHMFVAVSEKYVMRECGECKYVWRQNK